MNDMHVAWVGLVPVIPTHRRVDAPSRNVRGPRRHQFSMEARRKRPGRPEGRSGQFERAVDDLMSKKYGMGYIYYGERARLAKDPVEEEGFKIDEYLKDDAILVVGGTGRTGQWITLGLLNQGFNVRVLSRRFENAERLFGPSGANVDVFEADVSNPDTLRDPVDGAVGLVIAAGADWWRPRGVEAVEGHGAIALIQAAAAVGSVSRIVLLSSRQNGSKRAASHAMAEDALRASGIPYFILRIPSLSDEQGGLSSIILDQSHDASAAVGKVLTRVDAAQVVCQALVYHRTMLSKTERDPSCPEALSSYIIDVSNSDQPSILDTVRWPDKFANLRQE